MFDQLHNKNGFDVLLDEAIEKLASDNINEGVEALTEVARCFAKGGFNPKQFLEIRQYIIREAQILAESNGAPNYFVETKVKLAERENYARRQVHGNKIIIN